MAKKKKSPPNIPQPQTVTPQKVDVPFQPFSADQYTDINKQVMQQQMQYAPQIMDLYNLSAQKNAATRMQLDQQYSLPLAQLKNQQLQAVDPQFMAMNQQLYNKVSQGLDFQDPAGQAVMQDLAAGHNLGPGLEREIQQSIRGAQAARGNVLGAAPTAQEAFGTGQASENLYQQRLANALGLYQGRTADAQNFLQGRQPTDMWPALNATEAYNPSSAYVDQSLGLNVSNTVAGSQANYNNAFVSAGNAYNNALIGAADVNNKGQQSQYSNQWDQYLYKQALAAGIMTQPSSGGGSAMGMVGPALSGAGSLLGAAGSAGLLGSAAAGTGLAGSLAGGAAALGGTLATAGTAIAGGVAAAGTAVAGAASAVGAAVSAAGAAICWLARAAIPDQWMDWRRYLFTKASPELRRAYIYNARRLAMSMSWEEQTHIAELMRKALK